MFLPAPTFPVFSLIETYHDFRDSGDILAMLRSCVQTLAFVHGLLTPLWDGTTTELE